MAESTNPDSTNADSTNPDSMNRAERRAQRKGKNPNARQPQPGGAPDQRKTNGHNQVVGPRKFSGKRGNR